MRSEHPDFSWVCEMLSILTSVRCNENIGMGSIVPNHLHCPEYDIHRIYIAVQDRKDSIAVYGLK